jgi:hypothetical protein
MVGTKMAFQVIFCAKFSLFLRRVLGNADNFGAGAGKILDKFRKLDRLFCATGRIGPRKKENDHLFAIMLG